jgi:cell division protein FtsB
MGSPDTSHRPDHLDGMAKNKRHQPASVRFGPALKAALLCLMIGGSAVGYVWQKTQIFELGRQIRAREAALAKLRDDNKKLSDQLAALRSPARLDERVQQLQLGLGLPHQSQIVVLPEPPRAPAPERDEAPLLAARPPAGAGTSLMR